MHKHFQHFWKILKKMLSEISSVTAMTLKCTLILFIEKFFSIFTDIFISRKFAITLKIDYFVVQ